MKSTLFTIKNTLHQGFLSLSKRTIIIILLAITTIPVGYGIYYLIDTWYQVTTTIAEPPETIVGTKVTLRILKEDDILDYHNMFSDIVRKNVGVGFPEVLTLGYTIQYVRSELQKMREGKMIQYAIFDNNDKKFIGAIEIREKNNVDPGQLGAWVNENYWGGGRYQEAITMITKIYFKLHPHEKSYNAHIWLWNKRSYAAHKKAGMKDVGYFYEDGKAAGYILEMDRP